MSALETITLIARIAIFVATLIVGLRLWQFRRSDGALLAAFAYFFVANAVTQGWYVAANLEIFWLETHLLQRYAVLPWSLLAWTLWKLWRALHP